MGTIGYMPKPINKQSHGKNKNLVKMSSRWYEKKRSFLAFWQMIDLSIRKVNQE